MHRLLFLYQPKISFILSDDGMCRRYRRLTDQTFQGDFMLFHTFASQDERRDHGGSCFIEFQYCALSKDARLRDIVSIEAIKHWNNTSLYLHGDDMNEFWNLYSCIFTDGIYSNGKCGTIDMWGMNYYTPEQTELIIKRLTKKKPKDYQALLEWLAKAEDFNGFYILGI